MSGITISALESNMELRIKIYPFAMATRYCNLKQAIATESVAPNTYGTYGSYRDDYSRYEKYAIVYHAEVKKRKKYRGKKIVTIRKYRIPIELLRLTNCKVIQYPRYFRIVPNK